MSIYHRIARARRLRRMGLTADGAQRIEAPHVAFAPLEESSVWNMPAPPDPSIDEALPVVLAIGAQAVQCNVCGSQSTEISPVRYEQHGPNTYMLVLEACANCDTQQAYRVDAIRWSCIAAERAWDMFRQAGDTIDLAMHNESLGAEGKDLDKPQTMTAAELEALLDLRDLDEGS